MKCHTNIIQKRKKKLKSNYCNETKKSTAQPVLIWFTLMLQTTILFFHGNLKLDPPAFVLDGTALGFIATHNNESVIAMSPDHTYTIVGVFPLLPISPLKNGYKWANTQKLKNAPPTNFPHCGVML